MWIDRIPESILVGMLLPYKNQYSGIPVPHDYPLFGNIVPESSPQFVYPMVGIFIFSGR